jgi:DNA-binding CsgD family transcriptional regulator
MLGDYYEYSLPDIAEKLFMHPNTASNLERSAIAKFKAGLEARGYTLEDLLI